MRTVSRSGSIVAIALLLAGGSAAQAQSPLPGGMPPPPGMSLDRSAAMRFPQPVQVGALLARDVLQPVPSQRVLGTVRSIISDQMGTIEAVVAYGGFLGFGARPIAVPIDAMVLLGQDMEIVAYTPEALNHFPTFSAAGSTPLPLNAVIRVGLAKPSH
ncbi:MAG: PRC-barrel domain-containing protein [Acidibrevibacterium sp.]|jgi:hypothetical protein|uniref:PRC-barrel domain-containing protein n=1 Tax=Acidibrevibacterium fodinaquatile TaxID=1969806 RepID=UPI0023A7F3FE|nr:PRC-barrel domain-containing protein [Acidibrevibacterium fodinaquatile]MCA7119530.1 PRC-barrel domain-containing protein [Acidibrevibacterium fodinaquatile]